jgi:hypothetical protein
VTVTIPDSPREPDKEHVPSAGLPGEQVQAAIRIARVFSEGSAKFSATLVTLGTTFAIFSVAARLDNPKTWGFSEFLSALGFATLLVVLGCIEERFVVRTPKPAQNPPGHAGTVSPPNTAATNTAPP